MIGIGQRIDGITLHQVIIQCFPMLIVNIIAGLRNDVLELHINFLCGMIQDPALVIPDCFSTIRSLFHLDLNDPVRMRVKPALVQGMSFLAAWLPVRFFTGIHHFLRSGMRKDIVRRAHVRIRRILTFVLIDFFFQLFALIRKQAYFLVQLYDFCFQLFYRPVQIIYPFRIGLVLPFQRIDLNLERSRDRLQILARSTQIIVFLAKLIILKFQAFQKFDQPMIKVLFVKEDELSRFFITKIHKHNTQRDYSMRKSGNSVENLEGEEGNVKAVKNIKSGHIDRKRFI